MRSICVVLGVLAATGCDRGLGAALTNLLEAQKLAADMRVQLHESAESVQRAIMADTDESSTAFASEARQASSALEADLAAIEPIVAQLGSPDEVRLVQDVRAAFGRLQELDRTLLDLAVENTNGKAQRLAFGPAREAADAMRDHLDAAVRAAPPARALRAQLLAVRAQLGVREIQALQAPHIAEAQDAVMTQLEKQMADSESAARASLAELSQLLEPAGESELAAARGALERFAQTQHELLALSRENSDVRSLAVALGDRRTLAATCDAAVTALQQELAKHGLQATR
ncbi:MAG TPA: hypothetical protein VKH41_01500 [Myxococcota bacterium]|nr:hypothetical protein [Myxococcota bacterium]